MDRIYEIQKQIRELKEELEILLQEKEKDSKSKYPAEDLSVHIISKDAIMLFGGVGEENPKYYMDKAVKYIVKELGKKDNYQEFIQSDLTNPYLRLVLINPREKEFLDSMSTAIEKIKNNQ